MNGIATIVFIMLPSIATLFMHDIRKWLTEKDFKIKDFQFYWHFPALSAVKHLQMFRRLVELVQREADMKETGQELLNILSLPHVTEEALNQYTIWVKV